MLAPGMKRFLPRGPVKIPCYVRGINDPSCTIPSYEGDQISYERDQLYIIPQRTGMPKTRKKKSPEASDIPNPNSCEIDRKCLYPIPVFIETRDTPQHYELVKKTINFYGRPSLLTRVDEYVNEKINRVHGAKYMSKTYGSATRFSVNPGVEAQWDEYPYSSTLEGGFGSVFAAVDEKENNKAGHELKRFYRRNLKLTPGCQFIVQLAP
jgi:hypothetical protein